jgi:hypothetical protein
MPDSPVLVLECWEAQSTAAGDMQVTAARRTEGQRVDFVRVTLPDPTVTIESEARDPCRRLSATVQRTERTVRAHGGGSCEGVKGPCLYFNGGSTDGGVIRSRAEWELFKRLGDAAWNAWEERFPS